MPAPLQDKKIKLSDKQKEVVERIKRGDMGRVYGVTRPACYFDGNFKPHPNVIKSLLKAGIIEIKEELEIMRHTNRYFRIVGADAEDEQKENEIILQEAKVSALVLEWFREYCESTKRSGGVLITTSIKEVLINFYNYFSKS